MPHTLYLSSEKTNFQTDLGKPLRTRGCILLFCMSGYAIVECNFKRMVFRSGGMAVIFSDTLFSVEKASDGFLTRKYELSLELTDEATFITTGPFFDWLDENQVSEIPERYRNDIDRWLKSMDWIENQADVRCKNMMISNQWQNFFLSFESVVAPLLESKDIKTISSSRRLFHKFCQLLCENCRFRHDVKFYAEKLCITPYYLSKITYRIFQVSPKELIDRQLIMEIKALLTATDLTVKEIADRFCFESPSYLCRYFKKHVGMTPLNYRELQSGSL